MLSGFIRIQWRPTYHRFGKNLVEDRIAATLDVVHGSPPQPWRDVESEEEQKGNPQVANPKFLLPSRAQDSSEIHRHLGRR